jgi:hypothetical protein
MTLAFGGWQDFSGTGLYGFSALPGGDRYSTGDYYGAGMNSLWWMSSKYTRPAQFQPQPGLADL